MSDESNRYDPFADVINVLAAPIAGGLRSVEQFQRGIGELFRAVENLNRTLETLNETATRVNRLVEDVEGPVRALMPQITRTFEAADEMSSLLQGPVRVAAPNIERIVETLSSPGFSTLPNQLNEFMHAIGDVSRRLAPLTQFAENAGGLFGGFKLPGMGGPARPDAPAAPTTAPTTAEKRAAETTAKKATKKATTKKATTKKTGATKSPAKKSGAKRSSTTKKAAAKRA